METKPIQEIESKGWISLYRKLRDNPIYEKGDYLRIWLELLLTANHNETSFIWNNQKVTLLPGQLLTSQLGISTKLKIPLTTVNRVLKYLENENQIGKQSTTKYTVITILNWNEYQESGKQNGKQMENKRKTDGKQAETYNNDNNVNNDNKREEKKSPPQTQKESKTLHWLKTHKEEVVENLKKNYPDKNAEKAYDYFIKRMEIKSYGYTNYLKALQDWIREDRYNQFNLKGGTKGANQIAPEGKYNFNK